jgi:hypothetical protein
MNRSDRIVFLIVLALCVTATGVAQGTDSFAVGKVWKGERQFEHGNEAQTWKLTITGRTGATFQGLLNLESIKGPDLVVEVEGTGPVSGDGPVRFETDRKGDLKQHAYGKVKSDGMTLQFEGSTRNGNRTSGKGWLQLQK